MTLLVVFSLFVPGHDPVSQHMSELVFGPAWAAWVDTALTVVAGISVCLFAVGAAYSRAWFTALNAFAFGAAMISSGIVPTGSPLHGLYGLALFSVLVPASFAAEALAPQNKSGLVLYSLATSTFGLIYMWALLIGLDPEGLSGLTQRIATLVAFIWFGVIAVRWPKIVRGNL
ncbi:DUF998 domain-containing protein [Pontixanthobacter aestiaquae]|uniref:DUF998 domain-containing protein n=1 Tax=Pontixanthobacter aestiaquae TaxID=1509367 RepID=A0A844Z5D1_9SPHN|nr:DUF998 domain-containing protein [Pontixanthobacter aestiaquae]MDN3646305.1 DUF998 domain-containing protein [Pontixanthobacter aestiaquae]MXO82704.1 DUF998 domain-containing protein [Pontixanthobacter aestiaquae]